MAIRSSGISPAPLLSVPQTPRPGARNTFMVTWSLSESFGGMTSMCLKRAALFHERGVPSAVLTFAPLPTFEQTCSSIVASGKLNPDVPVLNLHEYYAARSTPDGSPLPVNRHLQDAAWSLRETTLRESDNSTFYLDYASGPDGFPKHRTYHRADGSIYLTDTSYPHDTQPGKTRRALMLDTPNGPLRFTSAAGLYRHWLAELVDTEPTDIIVDSKYSARFIASFSHEQAIKVFNFHSTHLTPGADWLSGSLSTSHKPLIDERASWDAVTFLTQSQRMAFTTRFPDASNTQVIGNPVDGPMTWPEPEARDRTALVHLGRFTEGKNIGEVVEIAATVAAMGAAVHLELIGDGEQLIPIQDKVEALGLGSLIDFRGHVNDVPAVLTRASVLLLCSKFEGQSLAILEAQAHGCVPVAYDIDFGPKELITHGETGFLIPFGDQQAAAQAIDSLLRDDELFRRMSRLAFDSAKKHSSDAMFEQWMTRLDSIRALAHQHRGLAEMTATLAGLNFRHDGSVEVRIETGAADAELTGLELLAGERGVPGDPAFSCDPFSAEDGFFTFLVPTDLRTHFTGKEPLDFFVRLRSGDQQRTVRLGLDSRSGSMPFLTIYGNLSFK